MPDINVAKAAPIGTAAAPDTHIHITEELPEWPYDGSTPLDAFLAASAAYYDDQAWQLEEALINSLPGGTYDRLLARMLTRKASHFRIPYVEVPHDDDPSAVTTT